MSEELKFWRNSLFKDTPWRQPQQVRAMHRITGNIKVFDSIIDWQTNNMCVQLLTGVPNIWTIEFKEEEARSNDE